MRAFLTIGLQRNGVNPWIGVLLNSIKSLRSNKIMKNVGRYQFESAKLKSRKKIGAAQK